MISHLLKFSFLQKDETFYIKKGTAYAQGIFVKYLTCDDTVTPDRVGGFGSTNRKEEEK